MLFTDTGAGMPEEVRARIFEPFFTTKGAQGTGLGLFVSYGIVERHGGQSRSSREPGRGTTFTITLPRAVGAEAPHRACARRRERTQPLRVLVVDDEEFVRETLADMVEALGHDVPPAAVGREALAAARRAEFDLVFTDLSMPEMDGWEVARDACAAAGPRTRVVIVTGYGRTPHRPQGDDPADAVIGKPFDFDQVEEMLARFSVVAANEVTGRRAPRRRVAACILGFPCNL